MCGKAILENGETFKSVAYCFKNQEMCNKSVENYPHVSKFVPDAIRLKNCVIRLSLLILLQ